MKELFLITFCLFNLLNQSTAQNIVKNGKFTNGITNWQVLLADADFPIKAQVIEHSQYYDLYGLADNYINTSFVELDAKSAIQQKVPTNKSDNYTLTFSYAHRPDAGDKQLVITADKEIIYTETIKNNTTEGTFKYKNIYFNAPSNMTKLSFYAVSLNGSEDKGILLTDVICEKTAEISINNSLNKRKTR